MRILNEPATHAQPVVVIMITITTTVTLAARMHAEG